VKVGFPRYIPNILGGADSSEARMTQSILGHLFQKLDPSHDEWMN
jgi:hypothetical protein